MNEPSLVTTTTGTVHVDTCRLIGYGPTAPVTAENSGALARQITADGAQSCRACKPVSRLATWERQQRKPRTA
jgi:hypothetical protein